jgi:predicted AlkP superfamily pyrophosphatase or phosphodiesterase
MIMRFLFLLTIVVSGGKPLFAQISDFKRPKLVVGIVIDQMRYDYLYRFYDRYAKNGFKRLLKDGFSCETAMINYIPTFTAPGHACVYTGSVPAINGIAGNDWFDNSLKKSVYCVEDSSVRPVGTNGAAGLMSPRNMLTTTITDELKLATNFGSKVFGISIKDRGAILPAGHLGNGAYWYEDKTGTLISSSYYGPSLPQWLSNFNGRHLSDTFIRKDWTLLHPSDTYTQSSPDDTRYEGLFRAEKQPVFPHKTGSLLSYSILRRTPSGNTYTFEASKACLNGESLGKDDVTDFLCISLSSTDYIGHQYGPNAVEIEDMYLRLDKDLADFINILDNQVGQGNYLLVLTADHGGAHNSLFLEDNRIPGGNTSESGLSSLLKGYADTGLFTPATADRTSAARTTDMIRMISNDQVYLNEDVIRSSGKDPLTVRKTIKQFLEQRPEVAYVIDMNDIANAPLPETIKTMAINGYNRQRSGQLFIIYHPGWYAGYAPTGTTHGTWNPHDAHIPLLWYGWGIERGSTFRTIHMEDISATLAALLHIQMPNGCIGKAITEIVK